MLRIIVINFFTNKNLKAIDILKILCMDNMAIQHCRGHSLVNEAS